MNTIHRKPFPRSITVLIVSALAGLFYTPAARAQVGAPKLINYQGRLTDASNHTLSNGIYVVTFELFDSKTSGTRIWGSTYSNVVVVDGYFNVVLGAAGGNAVPGAKVNDIGFAFGDPERYLQMTVESGPGISAPQVLQPRQQFLSVPYAMNGVPTGTILAFGGTNPPPGFLMCDGTNVLQRDYPRLFEVIGVSFGATSSHDFRVPDLRGQFLRGVSYTSDNDPDASWRTPQKAYGTTNMPNAVGSLQTSVNRSHSHAQQGTNTSFSSGTHFHRVARGNTTTGEKSYWVNWGDDDGYSNNYIDGGDGPRGDPVELIAVNAGEHTHLVPLSGSTATTGGTETRPRNVYVNFIIKY